MKYAIVIKAIKDKYNRFRVFEKVEQIQLFRPPTKEEVFML